MLTTSSVRSFQKGDGPYDDDDPTVPDNSKFGQLPGLKRSDDAAKKGYFYSFGRAIRERFKATNGTLPGLEGEVSQERFLAVRRTGARLPGAVDLSTPPGRAAMPTSTTGPGSITPQLQAPVDVLRSKMVCQRLVRTSPTSTGDGPQGFVQIPFRSAGSTASWVAENACAGIVHQCHDAGVGHETQYRHGLF